MNGERPKGFIIERVFHTADLYIVTVYVVVIHELSDGSRLAVELCSN